MLGLLIIVFLMLLAIGVPIGFGIGLSSLVAIKASGLPVFLIARKMYAGLDVYALLACPFYILAADIMNESGISSRLFAFADLLVGRIRGGLGHVTVVASMIFAGISGTALADAAGLGSVQIPAMVEEGYDKDFSSALVAAGAIIGPIIPPSIIMVVYAVIAGNVSIIALFMAGIVPGIVIGLVLMMIVYVISKKRAYPVRTRKIPFRECVRIIRDGLVGLAMPFVILGGILGGVFTPTESGAVAVFYAFLVGTLITKELKIKALPKIVFRCFYMTSVIFLIISSANIFSYLLTIFHAPNYAVSVIMSISKSSMFFLLLSNIFFLILGCLMEATAGLVISIPIFAPLAAMYGIDPLHYAIVIVVNLSIGCITPPVATSLYAVAAIAKMPVERIFLALIPFLAGEIGVLFLITYFPPLSLTLPHLLGLN